jgi:ribonuclease HI
MNAHWRDALGCDPAIDTITVYTDGACSGNPGPGGWGAVLCCGDREAALSGSSPMTTNNRMELEAVIQALHALPPGCRIELFTDSQYVQQGLTQWLPQWKRRNWRTSDGKPVKNQALWQALEVEAARHHINWHWVRGHHTCTGNIKADRLAREAIVHAPAPGTS